jgi:hypothetical protein
VAICRLKRVAADSKGDVTARMPTPSPVKIGKTVACIGAGPASMTVARDLAPFGFDVVVYDAEAKSGGMIRSQIPRFRLPESVIDEEMGFVTALGPKMRLGERVDSLKALGWNQKAMQMTPNVNVPARAALQGAGATIVDAGSLEQLKLMLDEEPRFPDALVFDLDLGAGKPDGVWAITELRAEWELLVPALVVTGRIAGMGTVTLPERCLLLGKPVALATLVDTLHRLVSPAAAPRPSSI